ncbi:MAG: hypothetical protein KGL39_20765 [Patescibacteria group bacterium]|nr:hypothetical protein [Patescibacteria group bacterium]
MRDFSHLDARISTARAISEQYHTLMRPRGGAQQYAFDPYINRVYPANWSLKSVIIYATADDLAKLVSLGCSIDTTITIQAPLVEPHEAEPRQFRPGDLVRFRTGGHEFPRVVYGVVRYCPPPDQLQQFGVVAVVPDGRNTYEDYALFPAERLTPVINPSRVKNAAVQHRVTTLAAEYRQQS